MEEEALELITGKLGVMDRTFAGGEAEEEERCKIYYARVQSFKVLVS